MIIIIYISIRARDQLEKGGMPGACNQVLTTAFTHLRECKLRERRLRESCVNCRIIYSDTGELTDVRADWPQPM